MDVGLSTASQMFLIPSTILFTALAAGVTHQLKTLLSLIGVATSVVWFVRIWEWTGLNPDDWRAAIALAVIFLAAWLVALPAHAYWWWDAHSHPDKTRRTTAHG